MYPVCMRISLLLIAVALSSACGDDESHAPLAPGGGGPPQGGGTSTPDGGDTVDDKDAGGTRDAGMSSGLSECARIDPLFFTSDEVPTVTATESPADFRITRQVGTWRDKCDAPTLVIKLSNGICPNGQGHELEFAFPANAIADGTIIFGLNTILPELDSPHGIRVRYTRPDRYAPAGLYGTCEGASGSITFYNPPDISRTMHLRARYVLMLTSCDKKPNPIQEVAGYFDVLVRRTLSDYCPR